MPPNTKDSVYCVGVALTIHNNINTEAEYVTHAHCILCYVSSDGIPTCPFDFKFWYTWQIGDLEICIVFLANYRSYWTWTKHSRRLSGICLYPRHPKTSDRNRIQRTHSHTNRTFIFILTGTYVHATFTHWSKPLIAACAHSYDTGNSIFLLVCTLDEDVRYVHPTRDMTCQMNIFELK